MARSHSKPTTSTTALQARGGVVAGSHRDGSAPARSPEQIESDIAATRDRLVSTVDQLAVRVAPRNVLARFKAAATAQVVDPVTGPRYERIAVAAGVLLSLIGIRVWRSRRRR